jgi:hypothetical protein
MHTWDIDVGGGGSADRFLDASKVWSDPQEKMEFFNKEAKNHNYFFNSCTDVFGDKSWNFAGAAEVNNVVPMSYSIYMSNYLKRKKEKEKNFTYDLVIRTRMDTMYEESIPSQEIKEVISNPDKLFVRFNGIGRENLSPRNNFVFEGDGSPFVADNFSFASSKTMDIYSDLYLNLNRLLSKSINPCPEILLGNHLKELGVVSKWSKIQFMSMIEWEGDKAIFEKHYDKRERKRVDLVHD